MSGIKCKCGKYFSTGAYPNPNGAWVVSEEMFDNVDAVAIDRVKFLKLFAESEKLYEYPHCKRIVLSGSKKNDTDWDLYKLDEN